eukprot:TRINITY_DN21085_c1_g1_i1.p2 TRINITY_DN21085_c1_g1~~TRINITY_DN21085_c1_g1_i1.p2  ORF type:complete len:117 (-),score=18.01 TRINITY_DN21085_c1_g1_i1:261-611(-)
MSSPSQVMPATWLRVNLMKQANLHIRPFELCFVLSSGLDMCSSSSRKLRMSINLNYLMSHPPVFANITIFFFISSFELLSAIITMTHGQSLRDWQQLNSVTTKVSSRSPILLDVLI